ncbi:hypothetical protein FQN60_011784, partial [Etheostoma spectabile]
MRVYNLLYLLLLLVAVAASACSNRPELGFSLHPTRSNTS